jgi:hypothetical protein
MTVRRVYQRAENRCEYCQTAQRVMGQAMHVEHIHPDGRKTLENRCLSCPSCNLSKARATAAPDPATDNSGFRARQVKDICQVYRTVHGACINAEVTHTVPQTRLGALDRYRRQAPDLVRVLFDSAVRRELPHVRHVEERLPGPLLRTAIGLAHPLLARDVCTVIGE